MEQVGFPWRSPAQNAIAPLYADGGRKPQPESKNSEENLADMTNGRHKLADLLDEKQQGTSNSKKRAGTITSSQIARPSLKTHTPEQTYLDRISAKPAVRTIPPWVRSAEEDDLTPEKHDANVPSSPVSALIAQHNHTPSLSRRALLASAGKHQQEAWAEDQPQRTSRWVTFAKASAYPRENFTGEKVPPEWLDEHFGDYSQPWLANQDDGDAEDGSGRYHAFQRKRQVWYKRSQFTILRNPFIPLVFRFLIFTFALIALGLGGSIFMLEHRVVTTSDKNDFQGGPSAEMAIIVDAIAILYIGYITYDEYFSKPLGLRSPRAKVRLILLDLFFIVFQTSNLSLAFGSMSNDAGACKHGRYPGTASTFPKICHRTETLATVLLMSLIAWLMTFSVSVLRLVERMNG